MVGPPAVHPSVLDLKRQGDQSYSARKYAVAIQQYSEALELKEDAVVLSNRSAAYSQLRQLEKALADAERALKLQPSWPRLQHRRAFALFYAGRYGAAVEALQEGLDLDPADSALSETLERVRLYTEAEKPAPAPAARRRPGGFSAAAKPAEAAKPAPRATGPRARYLVVHDKVVQRQEPVVTATPVVIRAKGETVEGVPCSLEGVPWLQLDDGWMLMDGKSVGLGELLRPETKSRADELREQGNTLFREQKFSKAVWTYTEAIEAAPGDARLYSNRAAAQMGQLEVLYKGMTGSVVEDNSYFKDALRDLEHALDLDPNYVKAYARKGQLHRMAGDKAAALASFKEGLRVDPSSAECLAGRDANS